MASGTLALLCPCSTADSSQPFSPAPVRKFPRFSPSPFPLLRRCPPSGAPRRLPLRPRALPPEAAAGKDDELARILKSFPLSDFVRFRMRDEEDGGGEGTGELQTSVVSYQKRFPWSILQPFLQVDLVSTIHIADKEYFETLQRDLLSYDCVLYEMVTSKESMTNINEVKKKPKASRSKKFSIIGFIQRQMARVLSLDFQLDCLDYQSAKWYNADLDYDTFKTLQIERGESLFTFARDMTMRSTEAFVQEPSVPENLDPWRSKLLWVSRVFPMPLLGIFIIGSVCTPVDDQVSKYPEIEALSRLDLSAALKLFLARCLTSEFAQITVAMDDSSVIIGERNKVAMEALQRAIDSGNNRIAILYGGGHMPDLGRRLSEEFNMVPTQVNWVTAWSIRNRELNSHSLPFLRTLAQASGWPLNRYQTLALLIFSSVLAVDLWFWELFFDTMANWASWATARIGI